MNRTSSPTTSATLAALSLAICLGAATEAGAVTLPRTAESAERTTLTAGQRQALASLLARLTEAARKLHHAPPITAAALASTRQATTEPTELRHLTRPLDRPHCLPTPPLRAALRNLPPPARR